MLRILTVCLIVTATAATTAGSRPAPAQTPAPTDARRQLLSDVREMNARLDRSRPSGRDVVAESERLRAGFLALGPDEPADRRAGGVDQQLAHQSLAWLTRTSRLFRWDSAVTPSLMRTYGTICDVYRTSPVAYRPWLWVGYGGANRMARALVLSSSSSRHYERALEEFALRLVAMNHVAQNTISYLPAVWDGATEPPDGRQPRTTLEPVRLPTVDEGELSPDERAAWDEVRARFPMVSARVHEARVLLEDLSARLRARNLAVNDADAATAIKMQGFLEDSVDLVRASQFAKAVEALLRAEYERTKLKDVTGQ